MDASILKTVGQIAGIGGIAIGMIVIVFRRVIGKLVGDKLTKKQTYNVLMTIVVCSSSIAVLGIGAWVFVEISQALAVPPAGNTRPDGISKKWQKTGMIMKDLSVYVSAKERGPKAFMSKNTLLAKLRSLDFPNEPNIVEARDELINLIESTPTVETGIQQDMKITNDMIDAFDTLFYLIRLEAINQGLSDWGY